MFPLAPSILGDLAPAATSAPDTLRIALGVALTLLLIALSAAFSGSETVLFSLTRTQLQHDRASASPLRRLAAALMEHPKRTLTTILIGNTAVNVLLYANTYVLFQRLEVYLGAWSGVASVAVSLLLVTIVGEAIPKTLGVSLTDRLTPLAAPFVHFAGYLLNPLGRLLNVLVVEPLARVFWGRAATAAHNLTTVELKTLLEMSRRHGVINPTEDAFLREVIDLGYLRVRDVMVPRVEVRTYDLNAPVEGLRELMRSTRRKKVPVYDRAVDNIVGLIYAKVLFLNPDKPLRSLVQPVRFVPELITCEQLLLHFRSTKTQLAIAVDEYGGMAGLVTLEDVLEAIVGDLQGPGEVPALPEIVQLGEGEFEVSGRLSVHYWAESFGLPRAEERVATIGGLVTARLGRPARVGDTVRLNNVALEVTSVQRRRAERLRLRLLNDAAGDGRDGAEAGGAG